MSAGRHDRRDFYAAKVLETKARRANVSAHATPWWSGMTRHAIVDTGWLAAPASDGVAANAAHRVGLDGATRCSTPKAQIGAAVRRHEIRARHEGHARCVMGTPTNYTGRP
jgi:hypothetical protein